MLKEILSGLIAVGVLFWVMRWGMQQRKLRHRFSEYHEKSEYEKQIEEDIAMEKGKSVGGNMHSN